MLDGLPNHAEKHLPFAGMLGHAHRQTNASSCGMRRHSALKGAVVQEEAEAAAAVPGGVGALLRPEGLYSPHLVCWQAMST